MIAEKNLTDQDIAFIRHLLSSHPTWSRWHLSRELAKTWDVRSASGQLKDMSVRNLLFKLNHHNLINLPPKRRTPQSRKPFDNRDLFDVSVPVAVNESLAALLPLQIEMVSHRHPSQSTFARLLARHHYLGYTGPVGEHAGYLVRDRLGRDISCLLFSSAAWKTKPRDEFIGWDASTRTRRLAHLANNSRFLILPWVRVPHLASHLLGAIARRLLCDWQNKYGHPVYAVETFVERDRFRGTCYKAANWIHLGQTQGRSRYDRDHTLQRPIKDIYLYPLVSDFRKKLCHGDA